MLLPKKNFIEENGIIVLKIPRYLLKETQIM